MARFTPFIELAQKLILKNGRSVVVKYPSGVDVDPLKPWLGKEDSASSVTVKGVFLEYNRTDQREKNDGVPLAIQVGDKRCLIAAGDITPNDIQTATLIEDRGQDWKIIHVGKLDPGDDPILYDVQLRA